MKSLLPTTTFLIVSSLAASAAAHPGHGDGGPAHYVTEPEHLLTFALFAAAVFAMQLGFSRTRRPLKERSKG